MNKLKWYGVFAGISDAIDWANKQGNILQFQIIPAENGYSIIILIEEASDE